LPIISIEPKCQFGKLSDTTGENSNKSFFAALGGYIKLEMLKAATKHSVNALQSALQTLREMNPVHLSA